MIRAAGSSDRPGGGAVVESAVVPLGQPLPGQPSGGRFETLIRYRHWPVFSLAWLMGRLMVFAAVLLPLGLMSALGTAVSGIGWRTGLAAGGWMVLSFLLMAFSGPLLAAWVRYRSWPLHRERVAVVVAVLVGMGIAFAVDAWGSARIEALLERGMDASSAAMATAASDAKRVAQQPWVGAVAFVFGTAVYFVLGGGLALSGYFREQHRWRRELEARAMERIREERRDAELRLAVLQAQVEPHFLFNALASIRALVRSDASRAEETIDALAAHLRATMPAMGEGRPLAASTVRRQVEIAASYLEVMRLRLGGRLAVVVDIEPGAGDQPFPPLLLITLVENAIKHGIEPKRGPGEVRLRARRDGEALRVDVIDDGVGLRPGQGGGVGLANVRAQLAAAYGDAASLGVSGRADGGCHARITVPWQAVRA